jgi:hypothetical protein
MPLDIEQILGGALGGAIVSSVLAPLIAQRRERREVRAAVISAIANVERSRWEPSAKREEFRAAVVSLRAAAMVAGAKRRVVDRYAFLAQVARRTSETSWELQPDPEVGGTISSQLNVLVRDAAELLVDHLWHPVRSHGLLRFRLIRGRRKEQRLRTDSEERSIVWTSMPF